MKNFPLILLTILIIGCNKKEDTPEYAPLTNTNYKIGISKIDDIVENGALIILGIENPDSLKIYQRGIVYNTTSNLSIKSKKTYTTDLKNTEFIILLQSLKSNTTYYIKPYSITDNNLLYYGETDSFKTLAFPEKAIDYEGNEYKTVKIGKQLWLKENLKSSYSSDGEQISESYDYGDNPSISPVYGKLYTWKAATKNPTNSMIMNQGVCPTGWHVPSNDEWNILSDYLGGDSISGYKLKANGIAGDGLWGTNGGSDEAGFSALPSGFKSSSGTYNGINADSYFWTSTEWEASASYAYMKRIYYGRTNLGSYFAVGTEKTAAMSVRCIYNKEINEPDQ